VNYGIKWTATPPIWATKLHFSGDQVTTNASGDVGIKVPGAKGWSRVVGSFQGSNQGKKSYGEFFTNKTPSALLAACGSSGGLHSLTITTGRISLS
jgi:hypothetical protein